jgi:glucosamine--fructose-6-phosphate aminotransferase (isomerizing)
MAGGQGAVSTKTYTCSVAVLMYLAFAIACKPPAALTQEVMRAVEAQENVLERRAILMPPIVEFLGRPPYVALMSRGADLATAYEGALLLKEVARLAAEPISAAQFRHGPMEMINPSHRYILFSRQGDTRALLQKLARDIRKANGRVLLFTDASVEPSTNLRLVLVEPLRLGLGTLLDNLYVQLLAHDSALRAGLEPGKLEMTKDITRVE